MGCYVGVSMCEEIHECKAIKVRCISTEIKPLKTEIKLYLKPQFVPYRKHRMLHLKRSIGSMFCGEVMAVYFSSHTKPSLHCEGEWKNFIDAFAKLLKATISFVMSARPSFCPHG